MKFKERFKKALFAFFKTEILEAVEARKIQGVQYIPPMGKVIETRLPYQLACMIDFDEERDPIGRNIPMEVLMERKIENARQELFKEFVKHVEVESSFLVPNFSRRREIRLSIYIGKKP